MHAGWGAPVAAAPQKLSQISGEGLRHFLQISPNILKGNPTLTGTFKDPTLGLDTSAHFSALYWIPKNPKLAIDRSARFQICTGTMKNRTKEYSQFDKNK